MTVNDLVARSVSVPSANINSDVLKEALKRQQEKATERVVASVEGLISMFDGVFKSNVDHLRYLRKEERKAAKMVKEIGLAFKYFGETGNPLPFFKASGDTYGGTSWCGRAGIPVPPTTDPAWNVPEGWEPNEPTPEVESEE